MKFNTLKIGEKVSDRWFGEWGTGKVVKLLKTRVYILFQGATVPTVYDKAHVQFLQKVGK